MPFTQPFADLDKKNDIIFGIQPDRTKFLSSFFQFREMNRLNRPIFIDGFADPNQPVKKDTQIHRDHQKSVLKAYPEVLNPNATPNAIDRKKSKGSIFWAAQKGITLHFVMYELATLESQTWVTQKNATLGGAGLVRGDLPKGKAPERQSFEDPAPGYWGKHRNVTNSELRWIYRMRNVRQVAQVVQFWRSDDGKKWAQCPPPWDWGGEFTVLWQSYKPTLTGFYESMLSEGQV